MLINKSIKKFILLLLFIALPVQTMTMPSWFSFSSMKKNVMQLFSGVSISGIGKTFKKNKTAVAIAVSGCIATCLGVLYFKRKKAREKEERSRLEQKRLNNEKKIRADQEAEKGRLAKEAESAEDLAKQQKSLLRLKEGFTEIKSQSNLLLEEVQREKEESRRLDEEEKRAQEKKADKESQQQHLMQQGLEGEEKPEEEWVSVEEVMPEEIEEPLKQIEDFLKVNFLEIHNGWHVCFDWLEEPINKFKKCLRGEAVNSLAVKKFEKLIRRIENINNRINLFGQQYCVGMRQGAYESYDVFESELQVNFSKPLNERKQSLNQFIQEGGVYNFLGFKQIPNSNVSYEDIKLTLANKKGQVDESAAKTGNNELTPEQFMCRQIEYALVNPVSEKLLRVFHRGRKETEQYLSKNKIDKNQQEEYAQGNNIAMKYRLDLADVISSMKTKLKSKRRFNQERECSPVAL